MDAKAKRFRENLKLWEIDCPYGARLLSGTKKKSLSLTRSANGEPNLQSSDLFYHSTQDPSREAKVWFSDANGGLKEVLIVFGVGLGYCYSAAKDWLRQDSARTLVCIESNLEVLRFLFETELATEMLQDPQFLLSFAEVEEETGKVQFYGLPYSILIRQASVLPIPSFPESSKPWFAKIVIRLNYARHYEVSEMREFLDGCRIYFRNFYSNVKELPQSRYGEALYGKFRGIPAIICGAGPSIEKQIPLLKSLQDRALILAGGTAMNVLNAYDFEPHFGAGIDPNWTQVTRLVMNHAFETPLFYSFRMNQIALRETHGDHLLVTLKGESKLADSFEERFLPQHHPVDGGRNVVNMSLSIAHALGCNPIICVGLDLAYTEKKGYGARIPHHPLHDRSKNLMTKKPEQELISIKDIYGEKTLTHNQWISESLWYSLYKKESPDLVMLNATEGGIGFDLVPNIRLQEAADQYLKQTYDFQTLIEGEILNASLPPSYSQEGVREFLSEFRASLSNCLSLLQTICEDAYKPAPDQETIRECQEQLRDERFYQIVLAPCEDWLIRYLGEQKEELDKKNAPSDSKERIERKAEHNRKRFTFLFSRTRDHEQLLDAALREESSSERQVVDQAVELSGQYEWDGQRLVLRDPDNALNIEELFSSAECHTVKEYHAGGKPRYCRHYLNNLLHGPVRYFDESGAVLAESWYYRGKKVGISWVKFPDGKWKSLSWYREGKRHGTHSTYYPGGVLKSEIPYKDDLLDGTVTLFYPEGGVKLQVEFSHGKRNGHEKFFSRKGVLISDVQYRDNHPFAIAKEWNILGELRREILFGEEGEIVEERVAGPDGKLHAVSSTGLQDDYGVVGKHAEVLTESLKKMFANAMSLAEIPEGSVLDMESALKKLQGLSDAIQSQLKGVGKNPENSFWKTPSARDMIQKTLKGSAEEMKRMMNEMQEYLEQYRKKKK